MRTGTLARREILRVGMASLALAGTSGHAAATSGYDAVVSPLDRAGLPPGRRFGTLGTAFAAAPRPATRPFRIWLARGVFEEQLVLEAPDVHLIGEDRTGTRLRFTAASGQIAPDGRYWGTFRTPTLKVTAPGFHATNLTIENGFDGIAEMRKTGSRLMSDAPAGPQAVALMLAGNSDRARLDRVDLHSHQDTFFPDTGSVLLRDCLVSGSYDFIFGAGLARFDACEIRSRLRPDPMQGTGYIAAPSTLSDHPAGLVFDRCRLTHEPGVPARSVYLGRPWRPSKTFPDGQYGNPEAIGMAAFLDCWMGAHIAPAGWTEMWFTDQAGDSRHMLQPEEVRFSEFRNRGPGAAGTRRGCEMSAARARWLRLRAS